MKQREKKYLQAKKEDSRRVCVCISSPPSVVLTEVTICRCPRSRCSLTTLREFSNSARTLACQVLSELFSPLPDQKQGKERERSMLEERQKKGSRGLAVAEGKVAGGKGAAG
jgi:hypothetical protein